MEGVTNQSIASSDESVTFFVSIYAWTISKSLGIVFSFISILFITPFFYFVIWYERYGANHKRTLINQFAASTCYYAIAYNLLTQSLEIVLSLFGPMGYGFCHLHRIIKAVIIIQCVQTQTAIAIVKYLYIFKLKSTSSLHDEFWCIFLNILTVVLILYHNLSISFYPEETH